MDKGQLIEYIRTLELEKEDQVALIAHIAKSEMNAELLDRVASVLEMLAQEKQIEADYLNGLAATAEELLTDLEKIKSDDQQKVKAVAEGFSEKIQAFVDEQKK